MPINKIKRMNTCLTDRIRRVDIQHFRKGVTPMSKKGIQNSSIEQIRNDHETETAFKADNPKKHDSDPKRTK